MHVAIETLTVIFRLSLIRFRDEAWMGLCDISRAAVHTAGDTKLVTCIDLIQSTESMYLGLYSIPEVQTESKQRNVI